MKIVQLGPEDAARYRELRLLGLQESPTAFGSSYEEEVAQPLAKVAGRLGDPLNYVAGALDEEGQLVGTAMMRRAHHKKSAHRGDVYAVYVHPEYRRQGVGRALMEALVAQARLLGLRQLNLSVVVDNPAPVRLYEQCGFKHFGLEREAFRHEGRFYDAAYMALRLD